MAQRFIVDIMSETHQMAVNNNLSYIEGCVLNSINYLIEHEGSYIDDDSKWMFLHISKREYEQAVDTLLKKHLIDRKGDELVINRFSFEELTHDPTLKEYGLDLLMKALVNRGMGITND